MDNFGERLRKLRIDRNKLQKEVSLDLGVSYTGYSSYENNLRMPGIRMLIKIADYYNVSIDYLLGRDDKAYLDKKQIEMQIDDLNKEFNNQIANIKKYINNSK